MAAHARLQNEFTDDEKCHNLMRWLVLIKRIPSSQSIPYMIDTVPMVIMIFHILTSAETFVLRLRSWRLNFLSPWESSSPWRTKTTLWWTKWVIIVSPPEYSIVYQTSHNKNEHEEYKPVMVYRLGHININSEEYKSVLRCTKWVITLFTLKKKRLLLCTCTKWNITLFIPSCPSKVLSYFICSVQCRHELKIYY